MCRGGFFKNKKKKMFECVSDVTDFYKKPNELLFGNKKLCNVFKNTLKRILLSGRNNFGRLLDRRPNHIKMKKKIVLFELKYLLFWK